MGMENISTYRKNLAKEVQQEPDKERRKEILEGAQSVPEYQQARMETISQRRQKFEEQQIIEEQREKLRDGESKEAVLEGVESFTTSFVKAYPQLNQEGRLNYYLSGSLAIMLLLKSGKFEVLNESRLPEVEAGSIKELPPEAIKHLSGFVRKIGDLDYVQTKIYEEQKKREVPEYSNETKEEYSRARERFLWKGGMKLPRLSESGTKVLKSGTGMLGADPLETVTPDRVARVFLDGKEIYIPEPKMMLAYKTVHLGQAFENADKTAKFVSDFDAMLKGMEAIYPREELLRAAHETLFAYSPLSPNSTFIPYGNPKFNNDMRKFYDEALATDPDASYLQKMQYGEERSVGVLTILHRYQSPEAKQAILDFFNRNKDRIDKWVVNTTSPRNIEMYADMLGQHPELTPSVSNKSSSREAVMQGLRTNPWAFDKYANLLPDKSALEMSPENSRTLDILIHLDEKYIQQELQDVGDLLQFGIEEWNLRDILRAKFAADSERRHILFDALKNAGALLDESTFKTFTYQVKSEICDARYLDEKTYKYINIVDEERPARVASVFEKYGIEYKQS